KRRIGACEAHEERLDMGVARAAGTRIEIELEVRVGGGGLRNPIDGGGRERRAAQVRVQDNPGRVDHAPQARAAQAAEALGGTPAKLLELDRRRLAGEDPLARGVNLGACGLDGEGVRGAVERGREPLDRGQRAKLFAHRAEGTLPRVSAPATPPRLTSLSHGAGCACKIGAAELGPVLAAVELPAAPGLLVGAETADDAAV